MSKKPREPKPKVRVADLPWNASVEGVLQQAIKMHAEHGYTDVVVIGVRRQNGDITPIDTLTFTKDRFRIAGIMKWATDKLVHR